MCYLFLGPGLDAVPEHEHLHTDTSNEDHTDNMIEQARNESKKSAQRDLN
jgi:hypothetical protein